MKTGFPKTDLILTPSHSGAWYNANMPGQGISLHVEQGYLYWFTYDTEDGSPRWYFGVFGSPAGADLFPIYTTSGGTFNEPGYEEHNVGWGKIGFDDDGKGCFWWQTSELGRGSMELNVHMKTVSPLSGAWFETPGQGFSAQFFSATDFADKTARCALWWFTYDRGYKRNGKQRWFMMAGKQAIPLFYQLEIYEYRGGKFCYPLAPDELPAGTGLLAIRGDRLLLQADLTAVGLTDSTEYDLGRV